MCLPYYSVLQDRVYSTLGSRGVQQIPVPPFTLIGATTLPGNLSHPLRRRFPLLFELEPMEEAMLVDLLRDRAASNADPRTLAEYKGQDNLKEILGLHLKAIQGPDTIREISDPAAQFLAHRATHSPATVVQTFEHAKVIAQVQGHALVTLKDAKQTVRILGIDPNGMHPSDRRVIRILRDRDNQPMGERALATALGVSSTSLRDMIEPRLVQAGLLELTSRGRKLTNKAIKEYH